ncbi:hypothetical protein SCARD494_13650 [Seiridium cardinale]
MPRSMHGPITKIPEDQLLERLGRLAERECAWRGDLRISLPIADATPVAPQNGLSIYLADELVQCEDSTSNNQLSEDLISDAFQKSRHLEAFLGWLDLAREAIDGSGAGIHSPRRQRITVY